MSPLEKLILDALAKHHTGEIILNRDALRVYQEWLVEKIKEEPFIYLAVDMGLGKTIAVLTALIDLETWPVLIVAPRLVAIETWPQEIEDWLHTKHLSYSVIVGTPEERELARLEDTKLYIINYENFQWLRERWGRRWPYETVVCDEATRLKAGKKRTAVPKGRRKDGTLRVGRRTSRFGAVARVRGLLKRVILMSGTPAPAGLHDLWGPMFILDRGERLGTSMTAFENRWFNRNAYNHVITPHDHSYSEIMNLVGDRMFALKAEDYIDMPPVIPNVVSVTLPPKIMDRYKQFERNLYDEEFDIEALNAGVLTNKLLQFANGSMYVDENTALHVHDLKLEALESIVTEANGQPILLAYEFRFDIDRIRKRYPKMRMIGDKKGWKEEWNSGKIELLGCHPASAGHGLNIQRGGHIGVWFGLQWSLEYFQQFIARLVRPGQLNEHVNMHYILARDTADFDVYDAQTGEGGKAATQNRITDAVRIRLQSCVR